uniref:PH domain-containing protein n=1 Tax=Graphocephala atropunctata TaxID=36148 RepID=A0A1B6ME67_9HEMI
MIGPVEKKPSVRIAGYLEKRSKMRLLVCRWKRWWFVLEGRLLLYYKSQQEYLNLSPCRGSLNMGLAASVRPGKGLELTVITRSQNVTLRAANRLDHEQWLQSLIDAMALPGSANTFSSRPVMHFRYSSQEHHENLIERIKSFRCPSYSTVPKDSGSVSKQSGSYETSTSSSHSSNIGQTPSEHCLLRRVLSDSRTQLRRPVPVRSSVRLSKIAFSDTSIPVNTDSAHILLAQPSEKCQSMQDLRDNAHVDDDSLRSHELACRHRAVKNSIESERAVLGGSKESKLSNSIKIELNLEDVQCKNNEQVKEQKIGNIKIVLDGCAIYGSNELKGDVGGISSNNNGSVINDQDYVEIKRLNLQLQANKGAKSDTDLTNRHKIRRQSSSCENMQTLDRSIGSTYYEASERKEMGSKEQRMTPLVSRDVPSSSGRKSNKKRSNSFLSRFLESKHQAEEGGTPEQRPTVKKRHSFLRKMWKRMEKKAEEEDYESVDYESIPVVIELPSPEVEKAEELLLSLEREDRGPEPEPPPDYDVSIAEELEVPPMLPPRQKHRPTSPWHDVPKNNQPVLPVEEDHPPPLPAKTKQKNRNNLLIEVEDSSCTEYNHPSLMCEPPSRNGEQKLEDLDNLLSQLSEVNTYVVQQIDISEGLLGNIIQVSAATESDYDIPRPHLSLLASMRSTNVRSDTFAPTHFLCTTPLVDSDSLDPVINRLDAEMTPDSLECDSPWSLTQPSPAWSLSHSGSLLRNFITSDEKLFPDSLNS